ncbi:MFS transporter [Chloroflexota bacterium]
MIFTLIPLFLLNVLGAGSMAVGLVGGLSESADAVLRIWSGWFSDKIHKRKLLTVLGYSISTIAKPFMYLATSWGAVLSIRFSDRIGKGIRSSSRDALIADSASVGERGRAFGLHRAMDTFGAVVGLLAAAVIIYSVQGHGLQLGLKSYQWLVLVSLIPAVLAVIVLLIRVHEEKEYKGGIGSQQGFLYHRSKAGFNARFKIFLTIVAVFTLGNSSDFFIILRAQNLEIPLFNVMLMLILFNVVYAAVSLPMGILSDKLGRRWIITVGWFIYSLVYLGFATASSVWHVWLLFACYQIYYGLVEGVARAFVADLVDKEKRGTAYGMYHGVIGLTLLPASLIAGWLWDAIGPSAPFYFGGGLAFIAMLGLMALIREWQQQYANTKSAHNLPPSLPC